MILAEQDDGRRCFRPETRALIDLDPEVEKVVPDVERPKIARRRIASSIPTQQECCQPTPPSPIASAVKGVLERSGGRVCGQLSRALVPYRH